MKSLFFNALFALMLTAAALSFVATSCTTAGAALELANFDQLATSADSTAATAAGVQPAPPTMSNGQARRYYRTQLAAIKAAQARKVKNSGNTTVEQTINNVSPATLRMLLVVTFLFGAVVGGGLAQKFGRA